MTTATTRVSRDQRFTRRNPCPICGGGHNDKHGRGDRCWGFLSEDDRYACCTSPQFANGLPLNARTNAYHHRLAAPCPCGQTHHVGILIQREPRPPLDHVPPQSCTRLHRVQTPIATHEYRGANGTLLFRVIRLWSKQPPPSSPGLPKCIPQRPDGAGDWIDGLGDLDYHGLYRLPELLAADPWEPVFIVEGEKCVDAIASAGGISTCNAGGAGKWKSQYREFLHNRQVVILADPDQPGRAHAQAVALDIQPVATTVRILELDGGDVADWLAQGHSFPELRRLAARTDIISALLPPRQESNLAMQDECPGESPITCPSCVRLLERLRIAETSLGNLRHERAIESRYLRLSPSTLSPPIKAAAIVVLRELKAPTQSRPHDEEGLEQVYRAAIARQLGVADQAAGTYLRKLSDAGIITRRKVTRGFHDTQIYIGEGPLAAVPEQVVQPQRVSTWGGKRVKACPACKSTDLIYHITCRSCGSVHLPEDLLDLIIEEEPILDETHEDGQEHAQEHVPPESTIVVDLASHGRVDHSSVCPPDAIELPRADVQLLSDRCEDGHAHHWVPGNRARERICMVCKASMDG